MAVTAKAERGLHMCVLRMEGGGGRRKVEAGEPLLCAGVLTRTSSGLSSSTSSRQCFCFTNSRVMFRKVKCLAQSHTAAS